MNRINFLKTLIGSAAALLSGFSLFPSAEAEYPESLPRDDWEDYLSKADWKFDISGIESIVLGISSKTAEYSAQFKNGKLYTTCLNGIKIDRRSRKSIRESRMKKEKITVRKICSLKRLGWGKIN